MGTGCSTGHEDLTVSKKTPLIPGLKIVIVGDSWVGKTSIFLRFIHNQYSPIYIATQKVNIDNVVQKINQPSHALVSMTLWDVPGKEEIDLNSTYFKDLDALIVVVDLTDEASIQSAPSWKQIALSSATISGQEEMSMGNVQVPVLLLGNKLDLIEESIDLKAEDGIDKENHQLNKDVQRSKLQLTKPDCIKLFEKIGEENQFTGSALVSAKSGDGSVHQTIQTFLRRVIENRNIVRRFQPAEIPNKSKKSKDRQTETLDLVGLPQFDELFEKGQVLVTRVSSLASYINETRAHFQEQCVAAGVIAASDSSLENCLVELRRVLDTQDIKLKLLLKDEFCVLEAKTAIQGIEIDTNVRYALKAFNKEFAAVCKTALAELPQIKSSLEVLDKKVDALCLEFQTPEPKPFIQIEDSSTAAVSSNNNVDNCNLTSKLVSQLIEKNRAKMRHMQHMSQEIVTNIESALKRTRTAFVW